MLLGLGLALLASLSFVAFDVYRKRLAGYDAVALTATLSLVQGLLFGIWWSADWVIRDGTFGVTWLSAGGAEPSTPLGLPSPGYWLPGLTCLTLNVAAGILFVRSLALSPFSRTIPILSLSPVLVAVGGALVLRELPSGLQQVGMTLSVVGVLLINTERPAGASVAMSILGVFAGVTRERGVMLMLLVAIAWSFTLVLDKQCMRFASAPAHATLQNIGVGLVLVGFLTVWRRLATLKPLQKELRRVAIAAFCGTAALGLQLLALTYLLAAVVETLKRGVGVATSVLLGRLWFGEPLTSFKMVGAALIVVGTAALAL